MRVNIYLREFYCTLALKFKACVNNTDLSSFSPSSFPFTLSSGNIVIL
jgi:hypothetical protein